MRFTDKTVLVTGGGGGIGSATVERFASEGARVFLMDKNEDHVAQTQDALDDKGISVKALVGDVTDLADLEKIYDLIMQEGGGVDVVVNVAGGSRAGYVPRLIRMIGMTYTR